MTHEISESFGKIIVCLYTCLFVCLIGLSNHDLWTPDEPRVAAISKEMVKTKEFIIPHLAGIPFIEKPPLYFAVSAAVMNILSPYLGNTTALRLTPALFGIGVLIVTFLIARRMGGSSVGVLSVLILATMEGFVENYHWMRVDAALAFFVLASIWCFIEVYFENRDIFCIIGAFFLACAFLSKGIIGLILVAIPWSGLVFIRFIFIRQPKLSYKKFMIFHVISLAILVGLCSVWMALLYVKGGDKLWNEWFWINHIGRFAGTAVGKGHMRPGQPFYYITNLLVYTLPWTPVLLFWFYLKTVDLIKKTNLSKDNWFLFIWAVGSIVILTVPTTKRGVYLLPVLPVFAIMSALSLQQTVPKWIDIYSKILMYLGLILTAVISVLPLFSIILPKKLPGGIKEVLFTFGPYTVLCVFCFLGCLFFRSRFGRSFSSPCRMAAVTAIIFICLLGSPIAALDTVKSMKADIQGFTARIPEERRAEIAGNEFSETMLSCFYYYSDWSVPQIIDKERVNQILMGKDKEFKSIIINQRKVKDMNKGLSLLPYHVIDYTITGRKRGVFWISGLSSDQQQRMNVQGPEKGKIKM